MTRHCTFCGADDLPMHHYGESKQTGRKLWACSACDPISEDAAARLGIEIVEPAQHNRANQKRRTTKNENN